MNTGLDNGWPRPGAGKQEEEKTFEWRIFYTHYRDRNWRFFLYLSIDYYEVSGWRILRKIIISILKRFERHTRGHLLLSLLIGRTLFKNRFLGVVSWRQDFINTLCFWHYIVLKCTPNHPAWLLTNWRVINSLRPYVDLLELSSNFREVTAQPLHIIQRHK